MEQRWGEDGKGTRSQWTNAAESAGRGPGRTPGATSIGSGSKALHSMQKSHLIRLAQKIDGSQQDDIPIDRIKRRNNVLHLERGWQKSEHNRIRWCAAR